MEKVLDFAKKKVSDFCPQKLGALAWAKDHFAANEGKTKTTI